MGDSVSVLEAIGTPSRLRLTRKERGGVRNTNQKLFVYYESIKRELKIKPIYECRCDGRLQTKRFTRLSYTGLVVELEHLKIKTRLTNGRLQTKRFTCLTHTGLVVELEHLKIKKRLTNEKFASVKDTTECEKKNCCLL
jgi:hypothetical protein